MTVGEVASFTGSITGAFTIPAGARSIDLNNVGAGVGTFKGNHTLNGVASAFVGLAVGQAYSFGAVDKVYGIIELDATGTTMEVTVNY